MKREKRGFLMIITGLTGYGDSHIQTVNLIYTILNSYNIKVSILDCRSLKEVNTLRSYIHEIKKNRSDFLILKIDPNNFELGLLDYFQLDIILHNNETDPIYEWDVHDYSENLGKLLPSLNEKGTIILNEDFIIESSFIKNLKYSTVTYGFNSKAEVTTSSISDTLFGKEFIFYQQKIIKAIDGRIINPQEYRINIDKINMNIYTIFGAITFALVCGIDLSYNLPFTTVLHGTGLSSSYENNYL